MALMTAENKKAETRKPGASGATRSASTRNYLLLIIGLIAVICFSLGLVLVYGSETLSSGQVWFLLAFLSLFVILSVSTVIWLVVRHARQLAVAEFDSALEWRTTSPEKQKRRLNLAVRELGHLLGVGEQQLADLRAAYIVAEDLALRRVQNEAGVPLMRKVTIGAADFDAVLINKDLVTCVAVSFLVRPVIEQERINRLLREAAIAKNIIDEIREGSRVRLLLLLVTQLDRSDEARLRSSITDYFRETPVNVDIMWMDFQELQKLYSDE